MNWTTGLCRALALLVIAHGFVAAEEHPGKGGGTMGITGKWFAEVPSGTRGVEGPRQTFSFHAKGNRLTGTTAMGEESFRISDGKIEGNKIKFVVKTKFDGNSLEQKYTGKVVGNEIKMTREGRSGAQEFTVKRAK